MRNAKLIVPALVIVVAALLIGVFTAVSMGGNHDKRVVKTAKVGGKTILVNRSGMTLYHLSVERRGHFICTSKECLGEWHPHDEIPAVSLHLAEELVFLDIAGRQHDGNVGHLGLERKSHLVAVEVVAIGHREARLERALVEGARGKAERLLRRQELGVRLSDQRLQRNAQRQRPDAKRLRFPCRSSRDSRQAHG